jgi:hypothetical protein
MSGIDAPLPEMPVSFKGAGSEQPEQAMSMPRHKEIIVAIMGSPFVDDGVKSNRPHRKYKGVQDLSRCG